ncbi:unnamed protein product (macronuclear) [Paramecium tetraurelia]|uniref:Uncharacterized protein n=1 Tax=Paramecium tetraurelia TaxID=5888 RepID=A0CKF5_PARTE|nr:uncharacterized protein GSPATT00000986001 [Paramecium tetraurelia]CAK71272.1 unnamed protein product [Paramecium tetraurelia]|eukprot:XP_001438669.1 hypothetical protein (macronuclear) [Paramecium tetraurelia strain d4-2]
MQRQLFVISCCLEGRKGKNEKLKQQYRSEFKTKPLQIPKSHIPYLKVKEENDKQLKKQAYLVLSGRKVRQQTPLDEFIKKRHEKSLNQTASLADGLHAKSKLDIFNI